MPTKSRTPAKSAAAIPATSDRLGELRREHGYTLQQFADTFGAKLSTVRDWLNGRVLPRAEALRAIGNHFEVTTDWLLGVANAPKLRSQWRSSAELDADVANHVARKVSAAIRSNRPAAQTWLVHLDGWRYDGATVLRLAVQREVDHLSGAFHGWTEFDQALRVGANESMQLNRPSPWPAPGTSSDERRTANAAWRRASAHAQAMIVRQALAAEAKRRISSPTSALVAFDVTTGQRLQALPSPSEARRKRRRG